MRRRAMLVAAVLLLIGCLVCGPQNLSSMCLAVDKNCECAYEDDEVGGDMHVVLRRETPEKVVVLVLSQTTRESNYLKSLQSSQKYMIMGFFKTFEAAKFMALAECPSCK